MEEVNIARLESVFTNMIDVMDRSKRDIFDISEESRARYEQLKKDLEKLKAEINDIITEGDYLEALVQKSRRQLAKVSQDFQKHSESELRASYEEANDLLVRLSVNRTEEKQLRERRDDLERLIVELLQTVERADHLANQVSIVVTYLTTDLKNVGTALKSAQQRKGLAIQIIQAQEEERKRLSREIHDGPAQLIANITLRAGIIEQLQEKGSPHDVSQALVELKELSRDALRDVRRIIFDLRPMALDDLGLIPTLEKYLSQKEEYHPEVTIHFQNYGEPHRFNTNFESSAFRLIQESVSNALKHAEAKDIWVKVEWLRDKVNISIKDNGVGFDEKEVTDKSFGLIGMKERLDLLKGEMDITSTQGKGTHILIKLPLPEKEDLLIEG